MANNTIERQIIPELPKVIDNEQINVYVPIASATKAGFAKFDVKDFLIDDKGKVRLKYPAKDLVKDADALLEPSLVKLLDSEFKYTFANKEYPYVELELIREGLDAGIKPQLVMLDVNDFEKRDYDADQLELDPTYNGGTGYNYYRIARRDPYVSPTIMRIDSNQFDYQVSGDAKLRVKYPYAYVGETTFNTETPSEGFGLVRPRLDWFKFNTDSGDDYGTMYFDEDKLLNFLNDPSTNPSLPDVLPIYGAVRDLQPWENKDLYYTEDNLTRPQAIRDLDTSVTGATPSGKIRLELTKEAIGLNKLANKYFSDWTYEDFGSVMKEYFNSQFANKLNEADWNAKFGDYTKPVTPYEWLTYLEQEVQSIKGLNELPDGSHTHPVDLTRYSRVAANTLAISINTDAQAGATTANGDFLVKLTPDYEADTPLNFTRLDIPYVPESQYLHNWKGQPSVGNFTKGTFVRYWVGTKQDLADDFGGIVPDDVIVNITDDYVCMDDEVYTKSETYKIITDEITAERRRGWANNGTLEAGVNYVLKAPEDGAEASVVPFDTETILAPYTKKTLINAGDGLLRESDTEFYTINGKRILTINADGALGLSTDIADTSIPIMYTGSELLVKPTVNPSSLLLYKNGGFTQLVRADIDSVYAVDVNPMVLPTRSLTTPPENITTETYTKLSDMILGVDVRVANKMPLTTSLQGSGNQPMFFAQRNGVWTQFTEALNINNSKSLIGKDTDVAGSIGKDLHDLNIKAGRARLSTVEISYASNGYGYDGYAASDINVPMNSDWQELLLPHAGTPATTTRRGDAIVARRIGLTSDNLTGNNRSSFNMRTIICRDTAHRDAIYNAMGPSSDRDNVLFMWPEA